MPRFVLDSRLQRDTHQLIEQEGWHVLLHRNAAVFWLILVPHTDEIEFFRLSPDRQQLICRMMHQLSEFVVSVDAADKINLGMIGNVVSQLHVHVIGRHRDDPYWPDPVWGKPVLSEYEPEQVIDIAQQLKTFMQTG